MALEIRYELAPAVGVLAPLNTFILDRLFPKRKYFGTQKVRFDLAKVENEAATFRSFADRATVVDKEGFRTIELTPLNINEAIIKTSEDAKYRGFGEPQNGGEADPLAQVLQEELEGFNRLKRRAKTREIASAYEALTTGKIQYGVDSIQEIDFGIPAEQIETVAPTWDDPSSDPVGDMIAVYDDMIVKPTTAVLGKEAYHAFLQNPNVITTEYNSNGKAKNVEKAQPTEVGQYGQGVIKVGTLVDRPLEIVCDMTVAEVDGTTRPLLDPKHVVYGSGETGGVYYGGVPVSGGSGVVLEAVEFLPITITEDDPAQVKDVYKSSPLPAITNPYSVWSQKVLS